MSFIIARVSGTVGQPVTVAVITTHEKNVVQTNMMKWAVGNFGEWASVQYIETYHVNTISVTDLEIDRLFDLDGYMLNNDL